MPKLKHLLRKFNISGDGFNHHNNRLPATDTSSASSQPPTKPAIGAFENINNSNSLEADFNFSEDEFQMQLALAITVSSESDEAHAESVQIEAVKQTSLGCSSSESLVEFLSLRYWTNNVVDYDEKVMDGFYDAYGIASNSATQGKMPSLVYIQAKTIYDDVDYEVSLVDRRFDQELQHLEDRVSSISLECLAAGTSQIISRLVERISNVVAGQMGGPVSDADEMLRRWTTRSYELRNTLKTSVLPLGSIDCGLSRHRALLFKVLADKINLACSLVKGHYYTGTNDGAMNFIKIDNGSEYIIDLMGAPGTLIPVEVPCCNLQSIELDIRSEASGERFGYTFLLLDVSSDPLLVTPELDSLINVDSSDLAVASIISSELNNKGNSASERYRTERFEKDFGKLLPALCRSREGLCGDGGRKSPAQKSQLNDVSKCVINAAKNPEFARKLHAVLLKDAEASSHFHINVNSKKMEEKEVRETAHLLDADMLTIGGQHSPSGMFSNKQYRKSFTEAEVSIVNYNSQLVVGGSPKTSLGYTLPSQSTVEPLERQHENGVAEDGPCLINEARANNIRKNENLDMKLGDTSGIGHYLSSNNHSEGISIDEGEWEIPWENLQIGRRIGIGSYGEVYHSEWNGTEVAVKKFMNQDMSGDALTQFKREVEIMLRLRHPNVVLFMGAVTQAPNFSILTEYLPRGSLFKLLHRSNVQLDERRRMRMALDVAKAMNYLHTSNPIIVHRDLKTPNLLVDENWVVKVCDFGMSQMKHHTFLSCNYTAGTPEWMAPEVLRNESANEKCDVYSFGVILWELATLRIPWTEMNSMQVVGAVGFQFRHLDVPEHVDPVVAGIISDCWLREPQSRPSFKEIISRIRSLEHLSTDSSKHQRSQ